MAELKTKQRKLDRVCENTDLAKVAEEMVSWEQYAPYCKLSPAVEREIKRDNPHDYAVQKRRMLEIWKEKWGDTATYRNLAGILKGGILAEFVYALAQSQGETKPPVHSAATLKLTQKWRLAILFAVFCLIIIFISMFAYKLWPMNNSIDAQYIDRIKLRYRKLSEVPQPFWLPTNMHKYIQLSLTSRDKPSAVIKRDDRDSANERIVTDRSKSFSDLISDIDASPGSRFLLVGQPGIGKTTLMQMITRYWAYDKGLSSCWLLLRIVLHDLVLLQHAPDLKTFLSFYGTINLPPGIEDFVLESDGKGLCFIVDGLDEYAAGYENETNFIRSELIGIKTERKENVYLMLSQSTVVVSSRPEVASQVEHWFDKRVEVLGFGDDQIDEYILEKYGKDKSLSQYMDDHPHIKHTCYIPLQLAMLVYLKDSRDNSNTIDHTSGSNEPVLLVSDTNLPETETEIYEQFIIHTMVRDACKNPTSQCSKKITLPTSLEKINELNSPEVTTLLFHIANLSYWGIMREQAIFKEKEVEPILLRTNSSLLVVDRASVIEPAIYSFPHLTIQEFLAAFYYNANFSLAEQITVLQQFSKQLHVTNFLKFCCGLKRNEEPTTFLIFFNWLYKYNERRLPYYCAYEAQSLNASQQLFNFTNGVAVLHITFSYYDVVSLAFVAVNAAEKLQEITAFQLQYDQSRGRHIQFFLRQLCDADAVYSQLKRLSLIMIYPSNIACLLQKSPKLEILYVRGFQWDNLQPEDTSALVLPSNGPALMNIKDVHLRNLNLGDTGVKRLAKLLLNQSSVYLKQLTLNRNNIGDNGASIVTALLKRLPLLEHVDLADNRIGGNGAALLWNQSIHGGNVWSLLSLYGNVIGDDGPDVIINALNSTVYMYEGYAGSKSCQNRLLCSDQVYISTIIQKEVILVTGSKCRHRIETIQMRIYHYVNDYGHSCGCGYWSVDSFFVYW